MQRILWLLFDLAINLFESGMFVWCLFKTLDCKVPKRYQGVLFAVPTLIIFSLLTTFNYLTSFEGMAILCYSAVLLITAIPFFYGSFIKKLMLSILPISCIAISVVIGSNLTSLLFNRPIADLLSANDAYYAFLVIVSNVLLVVFIYIIKCFFKKTDVVLTKLEWALFGSVLAISIAVFTQLFFISFVSPNESTQLHVALIALFLIALDFLVYYLLVQLSKKHTVMMENTLLRQQYEFQEKSATDIKRQYDNLQKMRHDYKNVLLVIQSLNTGGKQQEIDELIADYLSRTDITPTIITTDNEYVNAIVNLKIAQARESGITVTVDMPAQINFEHPIDLCNLLGNLFDNAIEACAQCPEQNRSIHLSFTQENEQFVLFMKNTVAESVLKNNPHLLTRKKNKDRHGYGTKIIKETAKKHHGFADFYEADGFFCCNVVLYM